MRAEQIFPALFAAGVVVAAATLAGAATRRLPRAAVFGAVVLLGVLATVAWVSFALDPGETLGLAAGGVTACLLAAAAAYPLRAAAVRFDRAQGELAGAERRLREVVERETAESAAQLERVSARTRAESVSRLVAEERKLGDERRAALVEHERAASAHLAEQLATVQQRVDRRLAGWSQDVERGLSSFRDEVSRLAERQRQALIEAEARIAAEVERLSSGAQEQQDAVARLRSDLGRAAEQIVTESSAELENHAAERRRALHELSERLRRRERELTERVQGEEGEAILRIRAAFEDVERRGLEELDRATQRAAGRYAEQAALQFAEALKQAREDAGRRLARELERAVETYQRQASSLFSERLAQVGDAGAKRYEKRLSQLAAGLERQRDELSATLEQRFTDVEGDLRRRLRAIATEAEAERSVLDARLQELSRRVDEALSRARDLPAASRQ